ncbi:hypothetical protein CEXT_324321, partial [Caerostris extrusa]
MLQQHDRSSSSDNAFTFIRQPQRS